MSAATQQLVIAPDVMISGEDRYAAMRLIQPFARGDRVDLLVIDGEPPSKARARFTRKGKPYTPRITVEGERKLAARFAHVESYRGNVVVGCLFYRSSRQRVDVDNLVKAVLDAATKAGVWKDDSQVTALIAAVELDRDRPRAVVCFAPHICSLTRGEDAQVRCEACGTLFMPGGQRRDKARWCSRACRATLTAPVPCAACGKPFKRRSGNQKYCSSRCRAQGRSAAAAEAREQQTTCSRGHELNPENTYRMPNGGRRCRRCQSEAARVYRSQGR